MATKITQEHKTLFLVILVLSLLTAITWISLSVFFSFTRTNLPPEVSKNLQPITPILDTDILNSMTERTVYTTEELAQFTPVKKLDPNAIAEPEPSGQPEPQEEFEAQPPDEPAPEPTPLTTPAPVVTPIPIPDQP